MQNISQKSAKITNLTTISIMIILLSLLKEIQSACSGSSGFWDCGYYNYGQCYQYNSGSTWSCTQPDSSYGEYYMGQNQNTYYWNSYCCDGYYDIYDNWVCTQTCYHNSKYINMAMYRKCSWQCLTCSDTSNPHYNCGSCRSPWYKWVSYSRCYDYCPSYGISWSGWTANSLGQYRDNNNPSDRYCKTCNAMCNFCYGGNADTDCYSCRENYYLVDDPGTCSYRFSTVGYSQQYPCYSRRCWSGYDACPPQFYFPVPQSTLTNNSPYSSWAHINTASQINDYQYGNTNMAYRQMSSEKVCYFCDSHCQTCNGPYQYNCQSCKRFNYLWYQHGSYCQETCPRGHYTWGTSDWYGEFIDQLNINIYTGNENNNTVNRRCKPCLSRCRWCRTYANQCYQCRNNYFLMDLNLQCKNRYITPNNCSVCQDSAVDMCNHASYNQDKKCVSACPEYFYFPVYRTSTNPADELVGNARYDNYTRMSVASQYVIQGTNSSPTLTAQAYRLGTNMCMLCDYRCIRCTGPMNTQCDKCRNMFYKWVGNTVCDQYCPIGQYIALDQPMPISQTQCRTCDSLCLTCQVSSTNCSTCVGANYAFYPSNGAVAFLYRINDTYSWCMTTCPTQTNYQYQIGYYGSYKTQTCYPCPTPCSNCNLNIIRTRYPDISCTDNYCSNGLICTNCLLGYVVVAGKCIAQNNCRQYAYYVEPAVSTAWSAVNCYCLDGYGSSGYATCYMRCHISCKSCNVQLSSTSCSSCHTGYTLSGGSCVLDATKGLNSATWQAGSGWSGIASLSSYTLLSCGSYTSVFGYQDQDMSASSTTYTSTKYLGYTFNIGSLNYYAITIKMSLLFVDQYNTRGAVYISRDTSSSSPVWSWNYDTKGAYGENLCGTNKMDYVLFVTAQLPTRNQTSQTFYISSNQNILVNNLGGQKIYWGLGGIYVTALKCNSACTRCSGPSATQCLTCSTTGMIAINGTCVCDISSNYYKWADGVCRSGCPNNAGWFTDDLSRSCVQPINTNCTPPYRFGNSMGTSGYGACVTDCPGGYWASVKIMKCTTDCWAGGLNQYKYSDGASRTCQDPCPTGYVKDTYNRVCALKCPYFSATSMYYLQIENSTTDPTCVSKCATGWQYDGLQMCVTQCPNGYFKYQTTPTVPSTNRYRCVSQCTNSYGNPDTGQCTLSCPFPKYADKTNWLCVDTCSNASQFMQVAVSNLNRTCTDKCQVGQWANPFTKKCSNYTTDCPDGYYADSTTRMCQANCTTGKVAENSTKQCRSSCLTGFAHWESRLCVSICPSNPSMFGYIPTKECVSSCNYASTLLYGDAQANRTCVQTCTASPTPTYGHNGTSLCVDKCPGANQFGDPADAKRRCVTQCSSVPRRYAESITKTCVLTCPSSYFGQIVTTPSRGVCVQTCLDPNFGDPQTNWCRPICKWGYFGWPQGTRPCLQKCPRYWFGVNQTTNRRCVPTCPSGWWGDIETSMCYNIKTQCSNDTYADPQKFLCVTATNCTTLTFADPFTKGCQSACSNGYYADSSINTCVPMCSDSRDQYGQWGVCRYTCIVDRFADPQANRTCVRNCSRSPLPLFGIIAARRICVIAANCPPNFYGNNNTLLCVNPCSGTLPFGDPTTKMCVSNCPDGYYGDKNLNLCVQICNFTSGHYADNQTGNCQVNCTLGTFGVNASATDGIPSCEYQCPPNSYARDTDRICVADCGAGLYGDPITRKCYSNPFDCSFGYFANSVSHKCVLPADCQIVSTVHYFAQNQTKTCVQKCLQPNYGDSKDWFCNPTCNETFFGQNTTRLCIADCSPYLSYAETQNNLCVARCSNTPIKHYAQNRYYKCVQAKNCPIYVSGSPLGQTFAQNSSQTCIVTCGTNQWADSTTFRCVATCPNGYYKDDSTGVRLCSSSCPGTYRFRDNSTGSCVSICPIANLTFGDSTGDQCVYTCPDGTFAQVDANRRCVPVCDTNTWGNKVTKVCITQPLTECPPLTWADDFTHKCEEVCDSGSGYYGYNLTKRCVTSCPSPTFAWDGSRVCIDICPASLTGSGYFGDPMTTPTRKCFLTCQTPLYYRDVAALRTCATSCTYNSTYKTYKDPTTYSCQAVCSSYPQVRYANDALKSCQTSCAGLLRKNDATRTCVSSCPSFYDPTTDKCVDICPTESSSGPLFANLTNNNLTCVTASNCPTGTYADADSRNCTSTCPTGTYKHGQYCVYVCPNDYFMDGPTQTCVVPSACSSGRFADNQTRSCVTQCIGTFGDSGTNRCIDVCYGNKFGDPFTYKCQTSCSQGLITNTLNRTCVASCTIGLYINTVNSTCSSTCPSPYYADNNTMACVTSCSANPMTFASVSSSGVRECVSRCDTNKMHDMINRICVATTACPTGSYSYNINMSCVAFCPGPSHYQLGTACVTNCSTDANLKYADDLTRKCVSICPSGTYKDILSYKCVANCPTAPVQYYISATQNKCATSCPTGSYADPIVLKCVTQCSLTPRMFAQPVNGVCVQKCPVAQNSYADPTTGTCVTSCPPGYFADKRDRTCKTNCSYLYADSSISPKRCVENCSVNLYANQLDYTCGSSCPPNYYKHTPTKKCVQFCPYGYYLNTVLSLCVIRANCPSSAPYADNLTHLCTSSCSNGQFGYLATGTTTGGTCVYVCTSGYSNPRTGKCQPSCPTGLFANTANNTCQQQCPYNKFMDSVNKVCVSQCPSGNNLYGDRYNRSCVSSCDPAKFTYADDLTRICEQTCTGNQYADDQTQTCVAEASCSSGLFSDPHLKKCVEICYNGTYGYLGKCIPDCPTLTDDVYSSQEGFICVSAANCPDGTYGDPVLHKCVEFCPIQSGTFADLDSKKCVTGCLSPYFADNLTRQCVETCPNISKLYGDTVNRKCVLFCQYPYFADETTNLCTQNCPDGYFADTSSLTCVKICPEGQYGNNVSNRCQPTCPSPYFGDPDTRMCILYCPDGKFADVDNNRQCHPKCIGNNDTYAQNTTGQCRSNCFTGFANYRTKQCIAVCTAGYYGYSKVCYQNCPSVSPTVYADNQTHLCVQTCPNGTFADLSTLKCVKICPISQSTFGDTLTWTCTDQCTGGYFRDTSTRLCVRTCPQVPALFGKLPERICVPTCLFGFYASNSTRMCQIGCPFGTYADNTTMKCQYSCIDPAHYGQNITNKCIKNCWVDRDMYADNMTRTCVYWCTPGTFADSTTRQCVQTCPSGYFAVNSTRRCEPGCGGVGFADTLLRICVARCSIDPIFYGDPNDSKCKAACPSNSFGNPLTQRCVHDSASISTCPAGYYGDRTTQLCVEVCPKKFDLYADPNTKKCETDCSGGLIADNSTMRCVVTCPQYPSYFANLVTSRCIPFCPDGTFADPISRTCVSNCPNNSYADNSTWRCVTKCPYQPLTFADPSTWTCVPMCPQDLFADNSTLTCVPSCPVAEGTFAENDTNQCVRVCPLGSFGDLDIGSCIDRCYGGKYADNNSRLCLEECPKFPSLYADPTTDQCVSICPPFYFAFEDNRTCVQDCPPNLYRQTSTSSCVPKCKFEQETYADNFTGNCETRCSPDSWADPTIRVCVAVCPNQPLLYADNTSQACVTRCPGVTYGQNTTRTCVNSCPSGSLSLPQKNLCVRYCPIGYFAYNLTQFCFDICPGAYYGDPSTRSCVLTCSLSQLLYADNFTKQCVSICSSGTYADKKSVSCVSQCPDPNLANFQVQTYAADYNNVCVEQCALPYYAYKPTKRCVTVCPNPYYNNLQDHRCKLCPTYCTSCTTYDVCTSCVSNNYLENGKCVLTCSAGYYASVSSMKCVPSALCRPYFGVNGTRMCISSCPTGSFANTVAYRCDACQVTCLTCISWMFCTTCDTNISTMYQNFCYQFCQLNDTNGNGLADKYYSPDNTTCYSACPNGTYLFVLFCRNCTSPCATCQGVPSNCTSCLQGLYLQGNRCVSKCSDGYKPNVTKVCVYCGTTCGDGLSFQTNITQVDGQNTVFITFSDSITLNGDPNQIFSLQTTSRRRLLASGYQIIIIDSRTIKIIIDNSNTGQSYEVKILQPQNIQDVYGNLPQKVRDQVQIDLSNTYTTSLSTASARFSNYFAFLACICVIAFLFDIQFMKFLQILYFHYFIAIILPPQLSKVLVALKYSTLNYLPTMYPMPDAVMRQNISGKYYDVIGDYAFLRNGGFVLTPLAVIVFIWVLVKILSVPEINRFKGLRMWCKEQLDQKFRFAVQVQWINIVFLNTIFFIFIQMKDYTNYDSFTLASIIISLIMLAILIFSLVYLAFKVLSFFHSYPKLSENLKKATDLLLHQTEYHKLNSSNIFLFQMKKIDLRNLFYPKINNQNILPFRNLYRFSFLPLCCLFVTYLRGIIFCAIVIFGTNVLLQMGLAIALNVATLLYFIRARPYSFKVNKRRVRNYVAIYQEAAVIGLQFLLLALGILDRDNKSSFQKEAYANFIIYYLVAVCSVSFVYFLFRVGVQIYRRIWMPFTQTQIFRVNFPLKYAQIHGHKKDKMLKGIDPKAKQALRNLIKNYKKNRSTLRPNQEDKANPQLPMKYKITYFDRDSSSIGSKSSMSKAQRRKMVKDIFQSDEYESIKDIKDSKLSVPDNFEELNASQTNTEAQYQEYEQEIEIKAKDLANYVKNADQLLRIKKMKQQEHEQH